MSESTILRQVVMLKAIPRSPATILTKDLFQLLTQQGFNISKRTLERDLVRLKEVMGYEQIDSPEGYKWAYIKSSKEIGPQLSADEALLLMQAKSMLSHVMPLKSLFELESKFAKAEETLKLKPKHKRWQQKIAIAKNVNLTQRHISERFREIIYNAVLNEQQLDITFKRNSGEVISTRVNAYGLIIKEHMQYLVNSRACSPNKLKLIKLPNVSAVDSTLKDNQVCTENIEKFIKSNAASYQLSEKPIKVKMNIAGPALLLLESSKLSEDQTIEYFDGFQEKRCGLLTATTDLTHDFVHFILGYGKWVKVLEPQLLKDELLARKTGCVFSN